MLAQSRDYTFQVFVYTKVMYSYSSSDMKMPPMGVCYVSIIRVAFMY